MGVLAPLYLAGLAGLALPLVLHLVRRTPRGLQHFSSLMFLAPTPPRLTRRSRLDQLVLLALRLAALSLLAFAFARPFLREAALLSLENAPRRKVALLLDRSASLRREQLWNQAVAVVERELAELAPQDEVALFTFDEQLQTVVAFATPDEVSDVPRLELIRQRLKTLQPGWRGTNLAEALIQLAGQLDVTRDVGQSSAEPQIVVVSDLQHGSQIDSLQAFDWPQNVSLIPRLVVPARTTNVFAHLLTETRDSAETETRVRVVSAADSTSDQFSVRWKETSSSERTEPEISTSLETRAANRTADAEPLMTYVPPGQSRVVKLPRSRSSLLADTIEVRGDDHAFDNQYYVVPPKKQEVRLVYLGSDAAADPQGHQFYLRLAVADDPLRQVKVEAAKSDTTPENALGTPPPEMVVLTHLPSDSWILPLRQYVEQGGMLVVSPEDAETAGHIAAIVDGVEYRTVGAERPSNSEDYRMLAEIQFSHPAFASFAEPQYSDFTKIHFWNHWPLAVSETAMSRVVARFDNGDPALLDRDAGQGRVLVFGTSWRPEDSDLALSSKFVPLIGGLLDQACGLPWTLPGVVVGRPVALPPTFRNAHQVVLRPDGVRQEIPPESDEYAETDLPGIYRIQSGADELAFAVNVASTESDTAPLEPVQLEQLGVRLGTALTRAERLDRIRQQRDTELEGRQKLWRWLIVLTLGVLLVETWWGGRRAQQSLYVQESPL